MMPKNCQHSFHGLGQGLNVEAKAWNFEAKAISNWHNWQLVQRGGDWAGPQPAQAPPRCTKCNSPAINGQCTNHCSVLLYDGPLLCGFNVTIEGLKVVLLCYTTACYSPSRFNTVTEHDRQTELLHQCRALDNIPCLTSILMISGVSLELPFVAAATGVSPSSLMGVCASPGEPTDRGAFVPFVMLNDA